MTDYNNFDYSNLTGFDYDEVTNKHSCTVAVTVSPTAPTDATTASQSFTNGTASTAFAAPVFKGIDGAELTGSIGYTYGVQTYASTAALTAVPDTLNGGATGTISYTFTPDSANYKPANGSISFEVIDAVVTGITLKSAPTKTTYEVGDTLDLTGEKTVTVKYSGFTVTFKVTVNKGSFTVEPQPGNMDGAYSINVRFCACASLTFMHSRIEVSKIFVFILSATVSREALTSLERFALLLYFVRRSPATVSFGF